MKLLTIAVLFPAAIAFSGNNVSSASRKLSPDAKNRLSFVSTSTAALLATGTAALRPQQSQEAAVSVGGKMQLGEESIMSAKAHGTFTGKALFVAPIGRSAKSLVKQSEVHGWLSCRDEEVVWDDVKVTRNPGETASVDGSHLGHNLPDQKGNRCWINLVCIAGQPTTSARCVVCFKV
jgi:hypothetical protein